jgi:uncharacterized protein with PIN domain
MFIDASAIVAILANEAKAGQIVESSTVVYWK